MSLRRWLILGLPSRSRFRHLFEGLFGVFFRVFFLGVFFNGFVGVFFVGVFFDVDPVRGFGVVRAYAPGATRISTGVVFPRSTGL